MFGIRILSSQQLAAIKAEAASLALSEASRAVAALKQSEIGNVVAKDIMVMSASNLTGVQKFEKVVANTAPLLVKYVTGGGFAAVEADVMDIARNLVQSIYNDVRSKTAPNIGKAILKLLGLA